MASTRKPATTQVSRDEAHDTYMQIFDEFAVVITDADDRERTQVIVDYLNREFAARKIDQTIVRDGVNGEYEVWQCFQTYDSISRDEAEARFDAIWSTQHPMRPIKTEAQSTTVASVGCRCGCGGTPTKGKGYLPGHDARHAGAVARAILGTGRADLLNTLPTQALRDKATRQVERGNSGPAKPKPLVSAADAQRGVVDGYIVVKRQRIPAQTFLVSGQQRMNINDAADGSGDWLDAEGYRDRTQAYWLKRFTPGTAPATPAKRAPRKPTGDGPESLKALLTF